MDLVKKMQIPEGVNVFIVNRPRSLKLDLPMSKKDSEDAAILVFAINSNELEKYCKPATEAAKNDQISWIAYPKSKQLDTDLNRDKLWQFMKTHRIEPVRLISINEVWSAMRFRPAK